MDVSLTGLGRGVLGGSAVLYAAGVALGYDLLVALGGGGLVALGLGVVLVARRPQVTIDRQLHPDRLKAGGTAQALVVVTNRGRVPSPQFTAVDRIGDEEVPVTVRSIAPGAVARVPYPIERPRRGCWQLGPVVVTRIDPLGLLRRRQPHHVDQTLWVHPRTHAAAPVPTGLDVELEGAPVEGAPRGAVTFSALREYVPGDDVRRVHWPSTARTGTLMVRDHVDTSQPRTTIALDARAERWTADAFEAGVEVAASIALAAERAGHPAVLVPMESTRTGSGSRSGSDGPSPSSMLDRLSLVVPQVEGGEQVVDRLDVVTPGGAVVFVTGTPDGPTVTRVAGLRRRFALVVQVRIVPQAPARCERRDGLLVLTAGTATAAIALWNRMVGR